MAAGPALTDAARPARLFLALWPDAATRRTLAQARDQWRWEQGSAPRSPAPVRSDKLHLTLHFIGNVDRSRLPALQAGLAVACSAFELAFGRHALWARGIAVLEPLTVPPALLALHGALGDALRGLGLPVEQRPFRPHVTLARHAGHALPPPDASRFSWRPAGYALVESRLDAGGGYHPLTHYPCR